MYRLTFGNSGVMHAMWAVEKETLLQYVYRAEEKDYSIVWFPNPTHK